MSSSGPWESALPHERWQQSTDSAPVSQTVGLGHRPSSARPRTTEAPPHPEPERPGTAGSPLSLEFLGGEGSPPLGFDISDHGQLANWNSDIHDRGGGGRRRRGHVGKGPEAQRDRAAGGLERGHAFRVVPDDLAVDGEEHHAEPDLAGRLDAAARLDLGFGRIFASDVKGTECVSESGMKRMGGGAKQCDRALARPS